MGKIRVGSMKQKTLVVGDPNLLESDEILITKEEEYTILRERVDTGKLKTYVVVPLEDFTNEREK